MKLPSNPLQPPFSHANLLSVDRFISFCKKNGVKTDKEELEFLEEEKLVYPAVRVHRGYFECKKVVNGETFQVFYRSDMDDLSFQNINAPITYTMGITPGGSIFSEEDAKTFKEKGVTVYTKHNWLIPYEENNMVVYPINGPFVPLKDKKTTFHEYLPTKDDLGWPYIDFYNKYQILSIKSVRNLLSLHVKNRALFSMAESGRNNAKGLKDFFSREKLIPFLQSRVIESYRLILFLEEVEPIWTSYITEFNNFARKRLEDKSIRVNEFKADLEHHKQLIFSEFQNSINFALQNLNLNKEHIHSYIWQLLQLGSFGVVQVKREYIKEINPDTLIKNEEAYRLINICSWVLWLLGDERRTVNEVILNIPSGQKVKLCKFCTRVFIPDRSTQYACSDENCQKMRRKENKQIIKQRKLRPPTGT